MDTIRFYGLAYNDGTIGDFDPEIAMFVSDETSPSGKAGFFIMGTHSGTISFWELDCADDDKQSSKGYYTSMTSKSDDYNNEKLLLSVFQQPLAVLQSDSLSTPTLQPPCRRQGKPSGCKGPCMIVSQCRSVYQKLRAKDSILASLYC